MPFDNPLSIPPDPVYLSFRDGLLVANDDIIDGLRWRWSPGQNKWQRYPAQDWVLDDVGLSDTAPGSGFDLIKGDDPDVERARADLWLPDVHRRVVSAYEMHRRKWPSLVWTWRNGGDWRSASRRSPGPGPGDGPHTPPNWTAGLTRECVQRVEDVREWVRRGVITAADGQRLIRQIVEDCTVRSVDE